MDYASYRSFRDEVLEKRRLLRLDCMNPAKALSGWAPTVQHRDLPRSVATRDDALAAWRRASGVRQDAAWVGTGIRDLLRRLVTAFETRVDEIWCPEDVYPVYAQIIGPRARRDYRTIPDVDWGCLGESARRAVLLCPVPVSPLGRLLTDEEVSRLATWLADSEERYLLVDAVYSYDMLTTERALAPLIDTGRVVVLWSCAKSWLRPELLGVASMSHALHSELPPEPDEPPSPRFSEVASLLAEHPGLSGDQQRAFAREWGRLATKLLEVAPGWKPPESGYFSVVRCPFDDLIQRHGVLAVPASVFGSRSREHSVVSCLHDLALHEREEG